LRRSWAIFLLWIATAFFAFASGRELAFNLFYFITGVIIVSVFCGRGLISAVCRCGEPRACRGRR
jgi:hypothetical protein